MEFFWSEPISIFKWIVSERVEQQTWMRRATRGGWWCFWSWAHTWVGMHWKYTSEYQFTHTKERRQLSYFGGGIWKKIRGVKALKRMESWSHDCSDFSYTSTFSNFHPPPIIRIIPLQRPLLTPPLAPGPSPVISGQGSLPAPTNDPISIFGGHKRLGL